MEGGKGGDKARGKAIPQTNRRRRKRIASTATELTPPQAHRRDGGRIDWTAGELMSQQENGPKSPNAS